MATETGDEAVDDSAAEPEDPATDGESEDSTAGETADSTAGETTDVATGGSTDTAAGGSPAGGSDDDAGGRFDQFTRSVLVTTTATLLGVAAGVVSTLVATGTAGGTPEPDNVLGFLILLVTVVVQFPLYSALGIDTDDFGTKTQLYIFAMTFFTWFITWTVLLTTGGLL